jgi:hypothetical protein
MVRRIDDLVLGTPGNRVRMSLALDKKQGSGVGHTLNASFMSLALDKTTGNLPPDQVNF